MTIHFAPMQGYVDGAYRRFHAEIYGGVDCYYTPFIRMEKGEPRRQDIQRLKDSIGDGTPLVPQIIFGNLAEFVSLSNAVKDLGFKRIDLNLGCPYPMQTSKGRGSAMIVDLDTMRQVCQLIQQDTEASYSVKMRSGWHDAEEWRQLLPILNDTPLAHLTIHPRIAKQMYSGELLMNSFAELYDSAANPIIYNGEIHTIADIQRIQSTYPNIVGVMIGRGLLARQSLAAEYSSGQEWPQNERLSKLLTFHDKLFEHYQSTLCGPTQILQHIKPFWDYQEPTIGHRIFKAIKKASTLPRYTEAIATIRRP